MILTKIKVVLATGALMSSAFAPAVFASTSITISGNGADSTNRVSVNSTNTTTVTQTNSANISNRVSVVSNTGGNQANKNTGGDVSITTGDVSSSVTIKNLANVNFARVVSCGCVQNVDIVISGNGADS